MLLSYAYASKMDAAAFAPLSHVDLVIDSGAFTALSSGKPINHDRYMEWLAAHRHRVRFAFALDVIGDWRASARNYDTMTARLGHLMQVVPTWHVGSPFPELDRLCRTTDYVSIGGAVSRFRQQAVLMRQFVQAHKIARDHGTRLHGLGITSTAALRKLPWGSVDSSSWAIPKRMPMVYLADRDGRLVSFTYGQPVPPQYTALVRSYGGDPIAMAQYGYSSSKHVGPELAKVRAEWGAVASARAYMRVESAQQVRNPGFRLYLAASPKDREPIKAHTMGPPGTTNRAHERSHA